MWYIGRLEGRWYIALRGRLEGLGFRVEGLGCIEMFDMDGISKRGRRGQVDPPAAAWVYSLNTKAPAWGFAHPPRRKIGAVPT